MRSWGVGAAEREISRGARIPRILQGQNCASPDLLARERHQSKACCRASVGGGWHRPRPAGSVGLHLSCQADRCPMRRPPYCTEQVIPGALGWAGLPAPLGSTTLLVRTSCMAVWDGLWSGRGCTVGAGREAETEVASQWLDGEKRLWLGCVCDF